MTRPVGRPTAFEQALEMAKMAWSPVLEILGNPELEEMDRVRYSAEPFHFAVGQRIIDAERKRHPDPTSLFWLTVPQVTRIHDRMIETFGGEMGVLDEGKIASALDRARHSVFFGTDPYPTILHKAAAIMHSILVYHPFADGQKRTGLSSAFIFLGLNGYSLWSRDPPDEVHFAVRVAKGEYEVDSITEWLADRVAPPSDLGESEIDLLLRSIKPNVRHCHVCHRYLPIRRYRVTCHNCRAAYKVLIRFGAVTRRSGRRPRLQATIGLVRERLPGPLTLHLNAHEQSLLMRPVRGIGGWNSLLRSLQEKLNSNGRMELNPVEILRIRNYSEHHGAGGFQSRLQPVLDAIRRKPSQSGEDY
jgi:death on curing protein